MGQRERERERAIESTEGERERHWERAIERTLRG